MDFKGKVSLELLGQRLNRVILEEKRQSRFWQFSQNVDFEKLSEYECILYYLLDLPITIIAYGNQSVVLESNLSRCTMELSSGQMYTSYGLKIVPAGPGIIERIDQTMDRIAYAHPDRGPTRGSR